MIFYLTLKFFKKIKMLVYFNNIVHCVLETHCVFEENTHSNTPKKSKKRKQPDQEPELFYVVVNGISTQNLKRKIIVKASDCQKIESKATDNVERVIISYIRENCIGSNSDINKLRISYEYYEDEHYDIQSIDKLNPDGMIVTLFDGKIRHFKFSKIQICDNDGVKYYLDHDYDYF